MKITIDLDEVEVKTIKAYLDEFDYRTKKEDIQYEISGLVREWLQGPGLIDYYEEAMKGKL